jgi:hypothetical protein
MIKQEYLTMFQNSCSNSNHLFLHFFQGIFGFFFIFLISFGILLDLLAPQLLQSGLWPDGRNKHPWHST